MENPFVRKMERHVRLAPEDRAVLDGLGRQHVRHVAARQDIEGQQSDPSHTHLILDGWACRYKQFPDGRRAIVALLLPGDLCDPFVFRRAHMDHAIGALTSVTVARIAPDQLGDAIELALMCPRQVHQYPGYPRLSTLMRSPFVLCPCIVSVAW